VSEIIDVLELTGKYKDSEISDYTSGVYNSMCNLGSLICPLLASELLDKIGYRETCDIMLIGSIIFALIFYFTLIYGRKLLPKDGI
jgi:MFS family permease